MKPGIRVVRGPDWHYGTQDGGPGFLGTLVKLFRNNTVLVRWDVGTETVCRAGVDGAFDLRIYDNAQIGETQAICDGNCLDTDDNKIYGFRWKCLVCDDCDHCTNCYNKGCGDITHPYVRYTTARALVVRLPPRKRSKQAPVYGIFPGAEVKKAVQIPGTEEEVGKVTEIIDLQPDAFRSAVKVDWQGTNKPVKLGEDGKPDLSIYRLGADGKVELTLVTPVSPGHVYFDHLPVLDLTMPVDVSFNPGDKVRIDLNLETFKALQSEYGGWVPELEKCLGEEGKIDVIKDLSRRIASVSFTDFHCGALYMNTLTKLSVIHAGDMVKIIEDVEKVKKCQIGHGGWQDSLVSILGMTGRVQRIDESGNALVLVKGQVFVFNQACLVWTPMTADGSGDVQVQPSPAVQDATISTTIENMGPKRKRFKPDEPLNVGARVVRGPDWNFDDQDGGEGYLGSIVEICGVHDDTYPPQCVVVQWDNGEKNVYRAGHNQGYDLRLLDNAGTGVKHKVVCCECNVNDVPGLMWQCCSCSDVTLCSDCYNADKHDVNHHFTRHDYLGDKGVQVPKRSMSKKVPVKGIFEKARVSRGPDWRWHNQDGGSGKTGEVIAIVNFSPDTDRDAAEVTWENGYTNVYRLGYKGRLDIKCVKPANGGFYYRDHIPVLKLDVSEVKQQREQQAAAAEASVSDQGARFKEGDRVRIEIDVDLLKMMEESRGAWNEHMVECLGKTGTVVVSKGQDISVDFEGVGTWTFLEAALSKVKEFIPGEIVKVNGSLDNVRMLQTDRGGWNDQMAMVVGKKGCVEEIDEDGDIQVSFGEYTWTFNPECLQPDHGDPDTVNYNDEESTASKPEPPKLESTGDEQFDRLFAAICAGDIAAFNRIIQREPQLMLLSVKGKSAVHLASNCGQIEIVKELFKACGKESLLEMKDDDNSTPLLTAVKGGQLTMIRFLVEQGANKDAKNRSEQTAVHMAVSAQKVEVLRLLRDLDFNINHKDMLKQSAIYDAITTGTEDMVKCVLDWPGLEVAYNDSIGFSPFCCACRKGDLYAAEKILEIAPGELNRPKPDGYTGLHVAVINNNIKLTQLLLQQPNVDIEMRTNEGRTPLLLACFEGHLELSKLLISRGCNKMAVDNSGKNGLHLCVEPQPDKTGWDDTRIDLAIYLITEGLPFDAKDKMGHTPLDLADGQLKIRMGDLLASRKDQYKAKDQNQPTSLPAGMNQGQGQSSPLIDTGPRSLPQGGGQGSQANQSQGQMSGQGQGQGQPVPMATRAPVMCNGCEEEEAVERIMPCEHAVCGDCLGKKKKIKVCPDCGTKVEDLIPLD